MGLLEMLSKALGFSRREARILVVGLDNSGKTTLVHQLNPKKAGTAADVVPTVGFQQEEFMRNNVNFTIFDMSGQGKYRSLWEQYYKDVEAVIYVLDRYCSTYSQCRIAISYLLWINKSFLFFPYSR